MMKYPMALVDTPDDWGTKTCNITLLITSTLENKPLEDLDVDRRIILQCILGKQVGKMQNGCIWFRIRPSGKLL
jgi:hypothetical protein